MKYLPLNVTDLVDCGIGKWFEEKCSPVKGEWWDRKDEPFSKDPVEKKLPEGNFECFIKMDSFLQYELNQYMLNRYKTCNRDVCTNPGSTNEIKVAISTCDEEPSYDRSRLCKRPPIKVYTCRQCTNPPARPPECDQDCQCVDLQKNTTYAPKDGLDCTTTNGQPGLCVCGRCYEYTQEK